MKRKLHKMKIPIYETINALHIHCDILKIRASSHCAKNIKLKKINFIVNNS